MNGPPPSLLVGMAVNFAAMLAMNAVTLGVALLILAALPGAAERAIALFGYALAYGWATWHALGRLAEDQGWTPFRRQLVFAFGHFLTMLLLLEAAITLF